MTDWHPTSLDPSNGDWDKVNRLQFILQANPSLHGHLNERLETGVEIQPEYEPSTLTWDGGILSAGPVILGPAAAAIAMAPQFSARMPGAGSHINLQQGLVDFVRRFLPGSQFNPETASEAFHLGAFLLGLFARLMSFPGGAALAYAVLSSLHRQVPNLVSRLNQESDLSIWEAVNSPLGKLIRKLLAGFDQAPVVSPGWLQNIEAWIHTVNDRYQSLETLGVFEEPDFLSRLFGRVSSQMETSFFPGEKAGWAGVVFYVLGLIFQQADPRTAERLFECGDLLFELSSLFNLKGELRHLLHVGSMDDIPLGPLDRFLAVTEGVHGVFDYGAAVSDLLDPSLNPYVSGAEVWPRRISVMLSGIEGILSTGSAIVSLSGLEAIAVFAAPLAAGIFICFLISWLIDNWDWISIGLAAWKQSWQMLTQIILPYRTFQVWHWFDDTIGRPLRERIFQPLGRWANLAWNGVAGLVQSLAGD